MRPSDADVAIAAVNAGAAIVRARFGTLLARIQKAPMDFATGADVSAERAILEVLRAARPADAYQRWAGCRRRPPDARVLDRDHQPTAHGWTEQARLMRPPL